jgi:predicted transport protein
MKNNRSSKKTPVKVAVVMDISKQLDEIDAAEFNNSFVLTDKGNLVPRKPGPFHEGAFPKERKFKSAEEMQDIVLNNGQILFGENTLIISERKEKFFVPLNISVFHALLFDFKDLAKPRLHLIAVVPSKQNFPDFFFRMTDFFALIQKESQSKFHGMLSEMIENNEALLKEVKEKIGEKDLAEFLREMLGRKLNILLITDAIRQELIAVMETYTETWGAMIKPIEMKKYASNGDILVTVKPDFASLQNGKKPKGDIVPKTTEGAHLENVSASVKEIYEKIKAELLKQDKSLLFNPKQYYISMKKNRNLAFFHLRKKNLYLVVMCTEVEVRKAIKHHIIKTLPPSVQKFWNGDSTGIVVEQPTHLEEIINLLKKMVGNGKINGNEPANHKKGASQNVTKEAPKLKSQVKQGKSDKKPQSKKK